MKKNKKKHKIIPSRILQKEARQKSLGKFNPRYKLALKHQLYVCSLLAMGFSPQVTADFLEEKYGIKLDRSSITDTYLAGRRWKTRVARMRRFFDKQVMRHPLASKANRLSILHKAIDESFTWRLDKVNYDKEGNEVSRVEKRSMGTIANLIREAREEVEPSNKGIQINDNRPIVIEFHVNGKPDGSDTHRDLLSPAQTTRIPRG